MGSLNQVQQSMRWIKTQKANRVIVSSHSQKIQSILAMDCTDFAAKKIAAMKSECFKTKVMFFKSPPNGCVIRLDIIWTSEKPEPTILDADFVYNPAWDIDSIKETPVISSGLRQASKPSATPLAPQPKEPSEPTPPPTEGEDPKE